MSSRTFVGTCILLALLAPALRAQGPSFELRFPEALSAVPLDGRLLVILSAREDGEPRFHVEDGARCAQVFGIDVEGWKAGEALRLDGSVFGFPRASLREVPRGTYRVQALLHRYETFRRSDGHVVKLPMDRGEGQQWSRAPGNLLSLPRSLAFDPQSPEPLSLVLDQVIPPIPPVPDTRYVKHVKIVSEKLSAFWGRPMELGACVLLPHGFDEHPEARYPLVVYHGHFPRTFGGFREEPPDPALAPVRSERFGVDGYNRIEQQEAHRLYEHWIAPRTPRFVIVEIQHANPYYDDSYAVNSANLGPYGDAIEFELIPYLEQRFRCIGEGWARFTYGGSTGGWEALAVQVFHPERYNGCFAACPDPIDFRAYTVVDLYRYRNAYYEEGPFGRVPRVGKRDKLGRTTATLEQMNHLELVLGTRSRSGQQWDIWEAVFSPVGADGYPRRIWEKRTGVIDPEVAAHWRERYDLTHILRRDWAQLGPKLRGKLHVYCGTMDNYFLEGAVYLLEDFLQVADPPADATVDFGPGAEHCWNGDHSQPIWISRLRYHQLYVDRILQRIAAAAPPGADLSSWRH
jgi:hypothetical protein